MVMCMKKVGVIKDVLDKLSLKDFYSVIAAIRGPDYTNLWSLKHIFTARIRYILFGEDIPGGVRKTPHLHLHDIKNALYDVIYYSQTSRKLYDVLLHFLGHTGEALYILAFFYPGLSEELKQELETLYELCGILAELLHGVYSDRVIEYFKIARKLLETEVEKKALDEMKERIVKWFNGKGKIVLSTDEEVEEFLHELEVVYTDIALDEE